MEMHSVTVNRCMRVDLGSRLAESNNVREVSFRGDNFWSPDVNLSVYNLMPGPGAVHIYKQAHI